MTAQTVLILECLLLLGCKYAQGIDSSLLDALVLMRPATTTFNVLDCFLLWQLIRTSQVKLLYVPCTRRHKTCPLPVATLLT